MRSVLANWLAACSLLMTSSAALAQTNTKQPTYETAFYPSGKLKIEAYVFKPEGAGPFPVVITTTDRGRGTNEKSARLPTWGRC